MSRGVVQGSQREIPSQLCELMGGKSICSRTRDGWKKINNLLFLSISLVATKVFICVCVLFFMQQGFDPRRKEIRTLNTILPKCPVTEQNPAVTLTEITNSTSHGPPSRGC